MKSRKGFTLVELILVIAIMGIITTISIPLIRNIREGNEDKKYKIYGDSLKQAAKIYVNSYEEDLFGREESGCAIITYNQLKSKNLIKDFQEEETTCAVEDTYVKIVKTDGKYGYATSLVCGEKRSDGSFFEIVRYPKGGISNSDVCGVDTKVIMAIEADPERSDSISFKRKNMKLIVKSDTGIDSNPVLYYGFSSEKDGFSVPSWQIIDLGVPGRDAQVQAILDGQTIVANSAKLTTPEDVTGEYYLIVKVVQLRDLSGKNWTREETGVGEGSIVYMGPYIVDNIPPEFNDSTIISNNPDYNSLRPLLNLNATDNLSTENDLKMCISYDTDSCSKKTETIKSTYEKYDKDKLLEEISSELDGSEHTIYVTVADAAGNYTTQEFTYNLPITITYNSNGGEGTMSNTICEKNQLCTLRENTYTKRYSTSSYWWDKTTGGNQYTTSGTFSSNTTLYVHWETNKIRFLYRLKDGETITPITTSDTGVVYNWSTDSQGFIYRTIDGGALTQYIQNVAYDATKLDLANYNNSKFINIKKTGYSAPTGHQWKCESGCKNPNQTFNQVEIKPFNPSDICDLENESCNIVINVNWCKNCATVENGTCTRRVSAEGVCSYDTSCDDGYELTSGAGTPNPVCTAKNIRVSYDSNGGNGTMEDTICQIGKSCTLSTNTFTKDYYTYTGWYNDNGDKYSTTAIFTEDTTIYANWRKNKIIFKYQSPTSEALTPQTSKTASDGTVTTYDWTRDSNNYIKKSVNGGTASVLQQSYNYDTSSIDLADYNNTKYLHITRSGYSVPTGHHWKCLAGCKQDGITFAQTSGTSISTPDVCNIKDKDCTISISVNWCPSCSAVENGKCTLSYTNGTCTYDTECNEGYSLVSGAGTPNPVCNPIEEPPTYIDVSYDKNGGYGTTMSNTTCEKNKDCTLKDNTYSRSNYSFSGWFTFPIGGTKYSKTVTFDSDSTVYAHWCENCSNVENGSCTLSIGSNDGSCNYTTSCENGYTLTSGAGTPYPVCTKEEVLPEYVTIKYNSNGGSGTMADTICVKGKNCTLRTNTFTRTGYTYSGWFGQPTDGDKFSDSVIFNADKTVYAHWCKNCGTVANGSCTLNISGNKCVYITSCDEGYTLSEGNGTPNPVCTKIETPPEYVTISYNSNGGTGNMATTTCEKGKACTLSSNQFTYDYHVFTGWYPYPTSGSKYGSSPTFNENKTVYAHWRPYKYTIKFNKNNSNVPSSDEMESIEMTYGVAQNLPYNSYTVNATAKTKQIFVGWKDAAGNTYEEGQRVINLTNEDDGVVELIAQWVDASYRIDDCGSGNSETKFARTLKEAEELASSSGSTIVVIKTITDNSTVTSDKSFALNIESGVTLTRQAAIRITGGTVVVKGLGEIYSAKASSDKELFIVSGNGELQTGSESTDSPKIRAYKYAIKVSSNQAVMALKKGWVHSKETRAIYLYEYSAASLTKTMVTCATTDNHAIYVENGGTFTITDSQIANGVRERKSNVEGEANDEASAIHFHPSGSDLVLKGTTKVYGSGNNSNGIAMGEGSNIYCKDSSSIYERPVTGNTEFGYCVGLDKNARAYFQSSGEFFSGNKYVASWYNNGGYLSVTNGKYFSTQRAKFKMNGDDNTTYITPDNVSKTYASIKYLYASSEDATPTEKGDSVQGFAYNK